MISQHVGHGLAELYLVSFHSSNAEIEDDNAEEDEEYKRTVVYRKDDFWDEVLSVDTSDDDNYSVGEEQVESERVGVSGVVEDGVSGVVEDEEDRDEEDRDGEDMDREDRDGDGQETMGEIMEEKMMGIVKNFVQVTYLGLLIPVTVTVKTFQAVLMSPKGHHLLKMI
jgi:hypothetical protein